MKFVDGSFFLFNDSYLRLTFFTVLDLSMALLWLIIVLTLAFYIKSKRDDLEHYKYFYSALFFKLFFGLLFSLVYIFYYEGGDSIVFWDGAVCMNRLFLYDPGKFFNELFLNFEVNDARNPFQIYNKITSYPSWPAMYENESYATIKLTSFFTFFTAGSYLALNIMIGFCTFVASWKLFTYLRTFLPISDKKLAISIFFIPSVAFWTSSVSKDAYLLISMLILIRLLFQLLRKDYSNFWLILFFLLFHCFLVIQIRSIILVTILIPFFIVLGNRFAQRFDNSKAFKRIVQFFIYGFVFVVFILVTRISGSVEQLNSYMKEAEVTQQDFIQNTLYTGKKYTIEITEFTPLGLVRAMPQSIAAGLFRPLPWEAFSPNLILNGIESFVFIYLTFRFFTNDFKRRWKLVMKSEFLLFALIFFVFFAFITGFSSIIFGVLVRLRAPLLIFFAIVMLVEPSLDKENNTSN